MTAPGLTETAKRIAATGQDGRRWSLLAQFLRHIGGIGYLFDDDRKKANGFADWVNETWLAHKAILAKLERVTGERDELGVRLKASYRMRDNEWAGQADALCREREAEAKATSLERELAEANIDADAGKALARRLAAEIEHYPKVIDGHVVDILAAYEKEAKRAHSPAAKEAAP